MAFAGERDARAWVVAALVLYFLALALSTAWHPYPVTWRRLGVPALDVTFGDLRGVLNAFECSRAGYDVLYQMPCDQGSVSVGLPYPRLWMGLAPLGLDLRASAALGVGFALALYASTLALAGRMTGGEALVYALMLCSPPVMLLVERANVDILIYLLLVVSVVLARAGVRPAWRGVGYALVMLSAWLKLLPVFAFGIVLRESRRWALALLLLGAVVFLGYCVLIADELKVMFGVHGSSDRYSFGSRVLFRGLQRLLEEPGDGSFLARALRPGVLVFLLAAGLAGCLFVVLLRGLLRWVAEPPDAAAVDGPPSVALNAFRAGAGLYLGTFAAGSAFDYKLSYLLLTLPQLILWARGRSNMSMAAGWALAGLVAAFHTAPYTERWLIADAINGLLWMYFLQAFARSLPGWLKADLQGLLRTLARRPAVD